ncbi:MAG: alpha-galactosidase [Lentisphaeria bacterium]|nr:alpha-galactosidase [Lentisphaeria bacterium]
MIRAEYSNGLVKEFAKTGDYTRVTISPEAGADRVVIRTDISIIDVHELWLNSLVAGPEKRNLPWVIELESGTDRNMPFVATFNSAGVNRGCFGSTNLQDDSKIRFEMNQEMGTYDITCTVTLCSKTENFDIILDCRDNIDWQDALADWRKALELPAYTYPEAAWNPVYCTWYAVHGAVTQDFVEKTCPIAKELGFTTLIVDDGWCYDDMKRVSPTTIVNWYEWIGDWNVAMPKFPDFKNHVKRIQDLGMKYMIWCAPHLWGFKSDLYKNNPGMTIGNPIEGYDKMDVNKADVTPLVNKLRAVAKDNNLDGLKIDFIDIVPPNVDKPNARDTEVLIDTLTSGLKEDNPEALIEFRQSYSTPVTLKYATQFRAGDVPFNWIMNFGRIVELRLGLGNLAPVHADPAYWPFGETSENVARHMMAMMPAVPMISMDLTRLTDTEKRIIRYYIDMYNAHRELINKGEWRFLFGLSDIQAAIVENDKERMVIICDHGRFPECLKNDGRPTYVMNLSARAIPCQCENAVDAECNPADGSCIPLAGSAVIK